LLIYAVNDQFEEFCQYPTFCCVQPILKFHHGLSAFLSRQGFTIPLDKRLAADGRGLQQSVINDKFAGLSEALFMAEAKAREAISMRAAVQKELLAKEKVRVTGRLVDAVSFWGGRAACSGVGANG
jgi:hypothetical protein